MPEVIHCHRYTLNAAGPLNAASSRSTFEGALIRVEDGFGCLHPWPELGDLPLDEQLRLAGAGHFTAQFQRVLECCRIDGAARREKVSLFAHMTIPPSHATLVQPPAEELLAQLAAQGFTVAKIKWRGDVMLKQSPLKLRLDANGMMTLRQFQDAFARLPDAIKSRIDFIEDPCPYDESGWRELSHETGATLALDRAAASGIADVVIWKPALHPRPDFNGRLVTTSYMDHPIGQLFAAWEAARLNNGETCGLLTHGLFEPDAFLEQMRSDGPHLIPPPGTGLGFDDLLPSLPWTRV